MDSVVLVALENGDRLCIIRGRPDDVAFAQDLISKYIASQPVQHTREILVPSLCLGRIIGRNGETIRGIQDTSKAKVGVDSNRVEGNFYRNDALICLHSVINSNIFFLVVREGESDAYSVVTLKGTEAQMDLAETLISEKVDEEKNFRNRIKGVASTRTPRRVNPSASSNDVPNAATAEPSAVSFIPNGIIEVYVSCVYHPNMFWIQRE